MNDIKEDLVDIIIKYLKENNIDPMYFFTLVCLIVALSYRKEFKNWENIEYWRRGLALSAIFAATVLSIISILKLSNIIDL